MRPSVLVVDDSLTVRMDLGDAFESIGFTACLSGSVAEARELLAKQRFDLFVLDVVLPDGDGVELLAEVKSSPDHGGTPVMLLSTESEVRDRVRGLKTGADEYVGKPYEASYVLARARDLVRRKGGSSEPIPPGRSTVLIIDDSVTYRERLKSALEAAGYHVFAAETGEEGLKRAAALHPDAVIVDGVLPGIDGRAVVQRMRADVTLRRTPCVMLTASGHEVDELSALDAGADVYVRKDGDLAVVLARLAALVRSAGSPSAFDPQSTLLGPKRILAVDDSATYLDVLEMHLSDEGYEVISARSGQEALELLEIQPVDCILLDLMMPGMSGHETCRRIKSSPALRDIPLMILTAMEEHEGMIEGINAGADDYIAKSSDFEVLRARLRAQLRRKQFEDENRRIREEILRKELEAAEAQSARQRAEERAVFLDDIERKNSELARANSELARAKEVAERESRFKSKFLASMSHELRTPLNAIIGFSELLEQEIPGTLSRIQREYVGNVLLSGRHLLTLINDILDISKIEAGKMDLRREWVSLTTVTDTVHSVAAPLAHRRGVRFEIAIPNDLPEIYVDPVRLKQVLYNLVSNGIKFTSEGGSVRVSAQASGRHMSISVADTGAGIRREDIPRLFSEFEQLDPVSGEMPEGTGLGLALTKRLVELHGGCVTVESEVGRGSTFSVILPLLRSNETGFSTASPSEKPSKEHPCVLVVEDDPKAADLIATHLRAAGLGVAFATNADEALALAAELQPRAITLDILMPGIDGWAILHRLKTTPESMAIPVVVISVVDELTRGLILGATDYLVKPVSRPDLLASLEGVGVPLYRVAGLSILLVGKGNGELSKIEQHLRSAGCEVKRLSSLGAEDLANVGEVDVVLLDLWSDPDSVADSIGEALQEAQRREIPIIGLVEAEEKGITEDFRAHLERFARSDALQPERLVRVVRQAVIRSESHGPEK